MSFKYTYKIFVSKSILISAKINPSCMSLPVCASIEKILQWEESGLLVTAVKSDFVKFV